MNTSPSIEFVSPNISSDQKSAESKNSDDPVPLLGSQSVDSGLVSVSDYPYVTLHANINTPDNEIERYDASRFVVREDREPSDIERVNILGESVDLVFVFDDTGSMSNEIDGAKEGVQFLSREIDQQEIDTRYALVTFKNEVDIKTDFTRNTDQLNSIVDNLTASGGGDIPEANFDAIERALDLDFRSDAQRVIVDITDAPSHYRGDGTDVSSYTFSEVVDDINDAGVTFISVAPDTDNQKSSAKSLSSEVGGFWADISKTRGGRTESFESILQRITELFTSTYEIEFHTCTPPGTQCELTVEFKGANGKDSATTKFSVPSKFELPPECTEKEKTTISAESADQISSNSAKKSDSGDLFIDADCYVAKIGDSVKFTVRSENNELISGATIQVDDQSHETDMAGRAEITFEETGVKTISATHPDSDTDATVTIEIIKKEDTGVKKKTDGTEKNNGEKTLIIEPSQWRTRVGEEVSFTVQNLNGDYIEDVTVQGPNQTKNTNVSGICSFVFNEMGTFFITAERSDMESDSIEIEVDKE